MKPEQERDIAGTESDPIIISDDDDAYEDASVHGHGTDHDPIVIEDAPPPKRRKTAQDTAPAEQDTAPAEQETAPAEPLADAPAEEADAQAEEADAQAEEADAQAEEMAPAEDRAPSKDADGYTLKQAEQNLLQSVRDNNRLKDFVLPFPFPASDAKFVKTNLKSLQAAHVETYDHGDCWFVAAVLGLWGLNLLDIDEDLREQARKVAREAVLQHASLQTEEGVECIRRCVILKMLGLRLRWQVYDYIEEAVHKNPNERGEYFNFVNIEDMTPEMLAMHRCIGTYAGDLCETTILKELYGVTVYHIIAGSERDARTEEFNREQVEKYKACDKAKAIVVIMQYHGRNDDRNHFLSVNFNNEMSDVLFPIKLSRRSGRRPRE